MKTFRKQVSKNLVFSILFVFLVGFYISILPPSAFSGNQLITIKQGTPLSEIRDILAQANIISHPVLFEGMLRLSRKSTEIQAGTYFFTAPENLFVVMYRLMNGVHNIPPIRITFPEGESVRTVALRVHEMFPHITAQEFENFAKPYEGYLFPDTYLFSPSVNAESIVQTLRARFETKIAPLHEEIVQSGHTLSDIVTMASLLEKEARTDSVRRTISGILWDRIAIGIPLQVDAVFGYIFARDTYSPLFEDLKVDSPYNTYTHRGLPPGPINNPGMQSVEAALHPLKTEYLYYLTDTDGVMHYARTYAEHQKNQRMYLH